MVEDFASKRAFKQKFKIIFAEKHIKRRLFLEMLQKFPPQNNDVIK